MILTYESQVTSLWVMLNVSLTCHLLLTFSSARCFPSVSGQFLEEFTRRRKNRTVIVNVCARDKGPLVVQGDTPTGVFYVFVLFFS